MNREDESFKQWAEHEQKKGYLKALYSVKAKAIVLSKSLTEYDQGTFSCDEILKYIDDLIKDIL